MQNNNEIKVINTATLRLLNKISVSFGLNRNLADRFFKAVDPDGKHVVSVLMVHEHAMMRRVEPHYRLLLMARMKGQSHPYVQPIDVPIITWELLPGLTKAQRRKITVSAMQKGVA